jgi:hypothetical protein
MLGEYYSNGAKRSMRLLQTFGKIVWQKTHINQNINCEMRNVSRNRGANITEVYVLRTGATLKGSSDLPAAAFFTVGDTIPVIFQTMSLSVNENTKDSRRRDSTTSEGKWQVSGCQLRKKKCDSKLTHLQFSKLETTANRMSHNDLKEPTETYTQARPPPRKVILM